MTHTDMANVVQVIPTPGSYDEYNHMLVMYITWSNLTVPNSNALIGLLIIQVDSKSFRFGCIQGDVIRLI